MFEDVIKQKASDIMCALSKAGENVNLYQLMFNPKLSHWVKTYLTAEVDWWVYEEESFRLANARFNMKDPKLAAFLSQYNELLKKNAVFSLGILSPLVLDSIKVQLNVLCRPRTALQWFVFRWEQSKPYHEIVKTLNYISEYAYLIDGFQQYVQDNNVIANENDLISCHQFGKIIREVDNQYLADLSPEDFIHLLSPLFEFFNKSSISSDTAKIPVAAVILFLDDKEMSIIASRLENLYKMGEVQSVSKKYLLGFIYKTLYELDNLYGESDDLVTNISNEIQHAINAPSEFSITNFKLSELDLSAELAAVTPNNDTDTIDFEEQAIASPDEPTLSIEEETLTEEEMATLPEEENNISENTINTNFDSSISDIGSDELDNSINSFDASNDIVSNYDISIIEEAIRDDSPELKDIISKLKD